MNNNLHLALLFLRNYPGAVLFPARWDGKQHRGYVYWSHQSSSDPAVIEQWGRKWPEAHFCINRQASNMVVLDIDVKKGKDGRPRLDELQQEFGALPETLMAATPSGGLHYIYSGQAANETTGKRFSKDGTTHSGIDIPVMIPVPGQVVKGKGEYKIIQSALVASCPQWVVDKAGLPLDKDKNRDDAMVDLDQPHHIADAVAYLNGAQVAYEGEGGDTATYAVACRVRDMGISEDTAFDLMLRFWNSRCQPPWGADELAMKVANAYAYAQRPAGAETAEAAFKDVPLPPPISPAHSIIGRQAPSTPTVLKEALEYTLTPPEDRIWIIDKWLPLGEVTSLYGHGGLGKSLLAVQLALAVSKGIPFLGLPVDTTMPVLGVFAEDAESEVHRRIYAVSKSGEFVFKQEVAHPFYPWSRAQLDSTLASIEAGGRCRKCPFYDELAQQLVQMGPGPKLLVLDTLADLFAGQENDREAANKFVKVVLGSFIRNFNCTVLLLAHPSLSGMTRGDGMSGSTAWNNAVRNRLTLEPHKHYVDYRILTRAKSNYARSGEQINLMWEKGILHAVNLADVVDEKEEANKDILFEEIRRQAATGDPYGMHSQAKVNIMDVRILDADEKELSKDDKRRLINELIKDGDVEKVTGQKRGNGLWPANRGGGIDDFSQLEGPKQTYNPFAHQRFVSGAEGAA